MNKTGDGVTVRAAIYARVSTTDQTCELQVRELREYASRRGWTVSGEYVDTGWSGAKASRPELDRLMSDARRRVFDCVVVWRFDRFARSVKHLVLALEEFDALGIGFVSHQEALDTSTPMGRAVFTIIGAMAELERNVIRERVRAGVRNAKHKGKVLGRRRVVFDRGKASDMHDAGASVREIASFRSGVEPYISFSCPKISRNQPSSKRLKTVPGPGWFSLSDILMFVGQR